MNRLLVVRLGSLGDLVHTLPAVSALHRTFPRLEIDWLVDAVHEEFLGLVPVLSTVVTLTAPTARGWLDVRRRLRARAYDVALDFQGLLKSAALSRLSGARRIVGFERASLREPSAAWLYGERVAIAPGGHVIEKNLQLATAAGARAEHAEFPIRDVESRALAAIRAHDSSPFALLNPGAAWPNKRWPTDRFAGLARWLRDRHGLRSIALWGPGEQALARSIVRESSGSATEAPPTTLTDLVALSRAAAIVVSGDTGPTHIAAAVGTPVVAIFGPTDPSRNGPWSADDRSLSRYASCECHYERRCRRPAARWCLATITEEDVRQAVSDRLDRRGLEPPRPRPAPHAPRPTT
jgi:lipopolysaccharide heptosyltransferase I